VTPEAVAGGPIAKIRDGDMISIDAEKGVFSLVDDGEFDTRDVIDADVGAQTGAGRELFAAFRERATGAEEGASLFGGG
jgi:phosphogluconate dehydratase